MVLKKLKSLLGFDDDEEPDRQRDIGVTVEREPAESPDSETEAAVKGTDGATEADDSDSEPDEPDTEADDAADESAEDSDDTDDAADGQSEDADETDDEPVEEAESEAETEEADEEPAGEPVDEIKGIGPAYAERLGDAGIETVSQLAEADPESLAAETDLSEKRVSEWVERAKVR